MSVCAARTELICETEVITDVLVPSEMAETVECVEQSPQEECSTRSVSPHQFINAAQDVSGHSNRGAESVNRCTLKWGHMMIKTSRVATISRESEMFAASWEARRMEWRREEQESLRPRARKDDGDHGGRGDGNDLWRRSVFRVQRTNSGDM